MPPSLAPSLFLYELRCVRGAPNWLGWLMLNFSGSALDDARGGRGPSFVP